MIVPYKQVLIVAAVGLALAWLSYGVSSILGINANLTPMMWQSSIFSAAALSSSTPAIAHGFPFTFVIENESVFLFSFFAFILNFIIYLSLGLVVLLLFGRGIKKYRK